MVNLIFTEVLKLKRSYMLFITLAGASVAPFINFLIFITIQRTDIAELTEVATIDFATYANQTNLFVILMIGILLYGLLTTYTFSREYQEDTLKNLLTIPVNRTMLILSKCLLILGWIQLLTIYALGLSLIFSWLGNFGGISIEAIWQVSKTYILTGLLMFLLVMPVALLTIIFRSFVASIALTIGIVIISIVVMNSEYLAVYPWTASLQIIDPFIEIAKYPYWYSWAVILIPGLIGLVATIIYFNQQDIQ